jgi:large repetitive protein
MPRHLAQGAILAAIGFAMLGGPASAQTTVCQPLPCEEILVELPYVLDFGSDHGKIEDGDSEGTGFTSILEPTNGDGYLPAKLDLDTSAGRLRITTTDGRFDEADNDLDNGLGVGIDAPSQVTRIQTTLHDPPLGTGNTQQAGLWFGNDEDNIVKLAVISLKSGPKIEFKVEVDGVVEHEVRSGALDWAGQEVGLRFVADPTAKNIEAYFSVGDGAFVSMGFVPLPDQFFSFDAANIDPAIGTDSFGGIYASHSGGPAPLVYEFDEFSVAKERDVATSADVLPEGIAFERGTPYPIPNPTSIARGPDGRLYVSELFGKIHALTLNADKEVIDDQLITTLGERLTLGLSVDPLSTPGNVILWATHSNPELFEGAPDSGIVSRLSGVNLETREDVITGLPRAIANHGTNSLHFGPDGKLYIAQGGNTGAGAPNSIDTEFGDMAEQPLSSALLVADVRNPGFDGSCHNPDDIFGPPPCDVTTYATGLRNMYDFVFHSNGLLYGPDNSNAVGTFPPSPTPPCTGMGDPAPWDADPPGDNPGSQPDLFHRIQQGKYYGHPNPSREECVFADGRYQGVGPLPNFEPPMLNLGSNRSANGTLEYASSKHCGSLKGDLLLASFARGDDISRVKLSPDGLSVVKWESIVGGFDEPLPLSQDDDGVVYVGEFNAEQVTPLVPVNIGCWGERASLPTTLLDAGGAALGGKLYVVAGEDEGGHVSDVYLYDPATDTWTTAPDLPGPAVENPAVTSSGGKLYAFGGSAAGSFSGVKNAAVFDPVANAWTALPEMPTARGGATARAIGSKIYVVGGTGSDHASLASVDVFDRTTGTWSSVAPMDTRRDNPGSAVLGGRLFVFGGGTRNADGTIIDRTLNSVEMYGPGCSCWVDRAPMPTGRQSMVVGTLNGHAQLVGGEPGPGAPFAANEEYDPATDSWRSLTSMPTARHGVAAGTIGDVLYTVGGGTRNGSPDGSLSAVNEVFSFLPFQPISQPPATNPPSTQSNQGTANETQIGGVRRNTKKGIAFLTVFVPGPGEISLTGRGIASTAGARPARAVDTAGAVVLKVEPGGGSAKARKVRRQLRRKGKATVEVSITYVPAAGPANTLGTKVKLIRK